MDEETFLCKRCNESKPREAFGNNKSLPEGRAFYCKACCSAGTSARRRADPEYRKRQYEIGRKKRKEAMAALRAQKG